MARHKQTNFDAGVLSPQLVGRTDVDKRKAGVGLLENFICQVHGPGK